MNLLNLPFNRYFLFVLITALTVVACGKLSSTETEGAPPENNPKSSPTSDPDNNPNTPAKVADFGLNPFYGTHIDYFYMKWSNSGNYDYILVYQKKNGKIQGPDDQGAEMVCKVAKKDKSHECNIYESTFGSYYTYTAVAYSDAEGYSKPSDILYFYPVPKKSVYNPTSISIQEGIKLKWTKPAGVSLKIIRKSLPNGEETEILNEGSESYSTSFLDTQIFNEEKYEYTFISYMYLNNQYFEAPPVKIQAESPWGPCKKKLERMGDTGYRVPDTGQTGGVLDGCGEASDYTINPMSFTDNGDNTVTDNNTKLMWEQLKGKNEHIKVSIDKWDTACTKRNTGGYNDWRLPTAGELITLLDFSDWNIVDGDIIRIDADFFPNTLPDHYITSTRSPTQLLVSFQDNTGLMNTTDIGYLRCVRGLHHQPILVNQNNGTIIDTSTGLMWMRDNIKISVAENAVTASAEAFLIKKCEDLTLANFDDWRTPSVKEYSSVMNYYTTWDPSYPYTTFTLLSTMFTDTELNNFSFLTSTLRRSENMFYTFMQNHDLFYAQTFKNKSSAVAVRCVR